MRSGLLILLLLAASVARAETPPPGLEALVPTARQVGGGRMTYLMWDVYDAALYAPAGHYDPEKPFALSLSYLRELKGKDIAERSAEEMRKQGFTDEVKLATWYGQMEQIFPDVTSGTVLTGIRTAEGSTVFERDGKVIGDIHDPEFTRHFFDIWLSKKTTAPELRTALLGKQ